MVPGIILMILSGITLGLILFNICMTVIAITSDNFPMDKVLANSRATGMLAVFFVRYIIGLIIQVAIFHGSYCMVSGNNPSAAKTGAILACIPCFSPLGFPFAIWALIVLNRRSD
jgi:hypothetical protein